MGCFSSSSTSSSASRIVFPKDSSIDDDFSHTDDDMMDGRLMESGGSEQMKSNNRCDDGDKNAEERVCTHCDIAFNDTMALQEHLYEIIAVNMKKNNFDGWMDDSVDSGSEDTGSQDTDNVNLENKNKKIPKKSNFSVRNSNITVMYQCLICLTHFRSQHYAQKHSRKEHPRLPGSRVFKTVYKKAYAPDVKDTKSKTAASNAKRSTNTVRKRKSEDRDASSVKVRRTTQDEEESLLKELLYRCNFCEVYFVSKKKALTHFESCRSEANTIEPVNCVKCGRPFEPKELVTHSVRDYRHSEVKLKIVNISAVLERQTPKGTPSEKKQDSAPKREKVPLFKCQECDAHFVTPDGLSTHKHRERHDMELIQCEICDFSFTTRSYNAHIIEHHDRLGLRRQDFEVVVNNVPDPSSSRRTRVTVSESDSSDVTEKETSESDQDWSPKKKYSELPPVMKTLQKKQNFIQKK